MANVIKFVAHLCRKSAINREFSTRYSSSFTKDVSRSLPKEATAVQNHDILLGSLKAAPTTTNILDIVKSHSVVMNNKHLIQALRSLFTLQKSGQSRLSTHQILKHPNFELLCRKLKQQAGSIELNDTIEALKVVNYVGVTSDSQIVQVLLQLIRHQINFISLQQIIFLDFLFNQMKSTPMIEALQLALPLVFEIQLAGKMDRENIAHVAECLFFAAKKNVSTGSVELLVNTIMNYKGHTDVKTMMSILWSVCEFKSDVFFEPIVTRLIDDLILYIDALNYGDIETTLSKLTTRFSNKHRFYYSDVLCDLTANFVIDNDMGPEVAVFALKKFYKFTHTNDKILNYLSEKFVVDESLISEAEPMMLFNYVNALALTDFRPKHWPEIKMMLVRTNVFKNLDRPDLIWLRLAANLCMLNIYKTDVFEMTFREIYLKKIFRTNYLSDFEHLILLKQAFITYSPKMMHYLPTDEMMAKVVKQIRPITERPLLDTVHSAFGGENYVLNDITTSLHHQIDHVVVLRKCGYPVAFTKPIATFEDIQVENESQILAIIALKSYHFTLNSKRLRGSTAFTLRTLEKRGCVVIPVNVDDWMQMPEFERVPYFMRLVKAKASENDLVSKVALT